MCMLTYLPPKTQPNVERLKNGTVSNRDGHGWAIVVPETATAPARIEYGHSMIADAAIESFRLARESHPEGPALFHSRYTTGGLVDESNCHPYRVCHDGRTLLAHNGVLPYSLEQPNDDSRERSDTRYFAEEWGPLLYPGITGGFNLNSKRGRRRLRDWLGNPNKFVILTVDPVFKRSAYILNEDQGIWEDDGCWYSNNGYKAKTYGIGSYYGGGHGGWSGWDSYAKKEGTVWDRLANARLSDGKPVLDKGSLPLIAAVDNECELCQAKGTVMPANWCTACFSCLDCFGDLDERGDWPCDCAWPTGTHPGRLRALRSAFADNPEDLGGADNPSGTGWPTTLGAQGES